MAKQLSPLVLAVDVGGTTVDAVGISAEGELIGKVVERASPSAATAEEVVRDLTDAIHAAMAQAPGYEVHACSIGMPNPFDYEAGVSHMVHKFQAIHGMRLGDMLRERIGLPVYFVNDADAFGLGVGWRQLPEVNRFVALTVGTGLGGCFIEGGRSVAEDERIPLGGEVWDLPYKGGILEDYVSARGVVALYDGLGTGTSKSAKAVAVLAEAGDRRALLAYEAMGTALGEGLAPVLAHFAPETIVVGGKVGLALDLFAPAFACALADAGLPPVPVMPAAKGNMALWGAARYALTHLG